MLLTQVDRAFDRPGWSAEIKLDGFRATAHGIERAFVSRQGRDLNRRFPELAPVAEHFARRRALVDGEIVAFVDGVPDFEALQARRSPVVYVAFDLLALDGATLIDRPLRERRELLAELVPTDTALLIRSRAFPSPTALYAEAVAHNLEGIVMKDDESPYVFGPKRTRHWLKVKTPEGVRRQKIRGETWGHPSTS